MDPVKLKKAILLFIAEFVVWLLAAVLSALSAFFDYQKGAPKK